MNEPPAQEVVCDIPVEIVEAVAGERREYCITHCPQCQGNHVTVRTIALGGGRKCPYCRRIPMSDQGYLGNICLTYEARVMPKERLAALVPHYIKRHLLHTARATAAEVHVGKRQAQRQKRDWESVREMVRASDRLAAVNED